MDDLLTYLADRDEFTVFYADKLRGSLFSAFLTLSGFLFSVKTFLIVRLDADVYSQEDYQDWVLKVGRKYNPDITVYGSLRRLGRLLFWGVCLSFAASIAQLTVGLCERRWSTWVAIGTAIVASSVFVPTLFIVRGVVRSWVSFREEKCNQRFAAKQKVPPSGNTAI